VVPAPRRPGSGEPDLTRGPQASLPGLAAWSDEDDAGLVAGPSAVFSTNPPGRRAAELPSIGTLGRYALKYRIGEGGLGTVYAAHDPTLSRLVAIKTVNVALPAAEREQFNALFLHEARAAAGLSHPNIVTVFDAGIADGATYIAMELLKGADLQQMTREGWRPAPAQAAQLAGEVADALAYAHAHGVIHRDIKPANIFMVGRERARVLDFGIARMAQQHDLPPEHEVSGGSPYYMAPEQILQQPGDARSDVYALGVVLYELLAGRRAFAGRTLAEIQRAVLERPPPLASDVMLAVPPALARIAARAMAIDPDRRYPSAAALARELRQWTGARARPSPAAQSSSTRPRGSKRRLGLTIAALLCLLALVAALWWLLHDRGPTIGAGPPAGTVQGPRA
jgi:eukaryotic-like serine/threonine-protein kinase